MRSLGGFVLLAGLGVGLFVYLPAPVDHKTSLDSMRVDNARRVAAASDASTQPAVPAAAEPGARSFSPAVSLAGFTGRDVPSATRSDTDGGWRTTASTATADPQNRTLEPTSPESRYRLIVDIQQQLKRVGCYYGRIDGSWGASSKYAIQSFMERVNAALPTDNPDYVLLTLLQSQSGKVCGTCAEDQTLTPGGRCVANATVAYGQPRGEPTSVTPETLPWQASTTTTHAAPAAAKPLFTPLPTSVVSTEPLPGRMTVGGPKELPPVNTVYAPAATPAGDGQPPGIATVAIEPQDSPPPAAARAAKPRTSSKKVRREGPGTPRYNLMLSLGGVY